MARYVIDRFEGGEWAVLEDERGRTLNLPRGWVPAEAREGDVLNTSEEGTGTGTKLLRFELDPIARDVQLAKARSLRERLPRGPKGDVNL